ncbi:WbqC family protein [Allomuricauda sp. d1]|uniref:WbqC family protein n=1 Tax=Allomuricauda sp. d1 TaxID=3136725 RepID=UPI0031CF4F5A
MKTLLHPTYFPDIVAFSVLAQNEIMWERHDNYQKQTYRNRCYVCTDQGRHMLNIPIKHVGGEQGRQKYNEVKIDNSYPWQVQHLKTLQTAYRSSPFFEFYEDDIMPLFKKKFDFLLDANLEITKVLCELLGVDFPKEKTDHYSKEHPDLVDARFLVNAKKDIYFDQQSYTQVFQDRHGFLKNVSVLDLLFNEGTNALSYLKNQSLTFLNA